VLKFTYDPSTFFVSVDPTVSLYIDLVNMVTNVTYTEFTSCGTFVLRFSFQREPLAPHSPY